MGILHNTVYIEYKPYMQHIPLYPPGMWGTKESSVNIKVEVQPWGSRKGNGGNGRVKERSGRGWRWEGKY